MYINLLVRDHKTMLTKQPLLLSKFVSLMKSYIHCSSKVFELWLEPYFFI